MFITTSLRRLRHGPLKAFSPMWLFLGKYYRFCATCIPGLKTTQYINKYGPFKLDAKFTFSNFENWGQGHNEGFEACIKDCRDKQCILDIGAHIGLVALPASQVAAGTVYAFEPAKANRAHLLNHIRYNHITNIQVVDDLVGEMSHDQVEFFERDDATGMNSRVVKKDHHLYKKTTHSQIALDDFCSDKNLRPDVIKIDVEGAELDVLKGAAQVLKTSSPIIYLSIHPKELSLMGASVEAVIAFLKACHYVALNPFGDEIKEFGFSEYRFIKKEEG